MFHKPFSFGCEIVHFVAFGCVDNILSFFLLNIVSSLASLYFYSLRKNDMGIMKICYAVVSLALLAISCFFTVSYNIVVKMGAVAYIHDEKLDFPKNTTWYAFIAIMIKITPLSILRACTEPRPLYSAQPSLLKVGI